LQCFGEGVAGDVVGGGGVVGCVVASLESPMFPFSSQKNKQTSEQRNKQRN
jgi:hypothetical protein